MSDGARRDGVRGTEGFWFEKLWEAEQRHGAVSVSQPRHDHHPNLNLLPVPSASPASPAAVLEVRLRPAEYTPVPFRPARSGAAYSALSRSCAISASFHS